MRNKKFKEAQHEFMKAFNRLMGASNKDGAKVVLKCAVAANILGSVTSNPFANDLTYDFLDDVDVSRLMDLQNSYEEKNLSKARSILEAHVSSMFGDTEPLSLYGASLMLFLDNSGEAINFNDTELLRSLQEKMQTRRDEEMAKQLQDEDRAHDYDGNSDGEGGLLSSGAVYSIICGEAPPNPIILQVIRIEGGRQMVLSDGVHSICHPVLPSASTTGGALWGGCLIEVKRYLMSPVFVIQALEVTSEPFPLIGNPQPLEPQLLDTGSADDEPPPLMTIDGDLPTLSYPILRYVEEGDEERVLQAIDDGQMICVDESGSDAAMVAARYGRDKILKHLIDANIDLKRVNNNGWNALRHAKSKHTHGHRRCVLLIESAMSLRESREASLKAKDDKKNSRTTAAPSGIGASASSSVSGGSTVTPASSGTGTATSGAGGGGGGGKKKGKKKRRHDRDEYSSDEEGEPSVAANPLHVASRKGDGDALQKALAEEGTNVDVQDDKGMSALHVAIKYKRFACVKILIDANCSLEVQDDKGNTPLLFLSRWGGDPDILELLLGKGCNVNAVNEEGRTALMEAAYRGHSHILNELINAKANLEAKSPEGETAIFFAVKGKKYECVKMLINANADLAVVDIESESLVHHAVRLNDTNSLKLLITAGVTGKKLDVKSLEAGNTPMHIAVLEGHVDCVQQLMDAEASPYIQNISGKSVLKCAQESIEDEKRCFDVIEKVIKINKEKRKREEKKAKKQGAGGKEEASKSVGSSSPLVDTKVENGNGPKEKGKEKTKGVVKVVPSMMMVPRSKEEAEGAERMRRELETLNREREKEEARDRKLKCIEQMESAFQNGTFPPNVPLEYLNEWTDGFNDRYKLGAGAFGAVFKGVFIPDDMTEGTNARFKAVAVKRLSRELTIAGSKDKGKDDYAAFLNNFKREVNALSHIRHPNVIKVLGYSLPPRVGDAEPELYVMYELAHHGDLGRNLKDHDAAVRFDWIKRVNVLLGVAKALNNLHGKHIYHRDLKSANIALAIDYSARIIDFGLAKFLPPVNTDSTLSVAQTAVGGIGAMGGTEGYKCPYISHYPSVCLKDGVFDDPKFDIFAFGIVILELLMGKRQNEGGVLLHQLEESEWIPDPRAGAWPEDCVEVLIKIHKACVGEPLGRFKLMYDNRIKSIGMILPQLTGLYMKYCKSALCDPTERAIFEERLKSEKHDLTVRVSSRIEYRECECCYSSTPIDKGVCV